MDPSLIPFMKSETSLNSRISSLLEPILCSDEYCIYPFGRACEPCTLVLEAKEQAREQRYQHPSPEDGSHNYISPANPSNANIEAAEQIFFDGASSRHSQSTKTARSKEQHHGNPNEYEPGTRPVMTIIPYRSRSNSPIPTNQLTETSGYPITPCTTTTSSQISQISQTSQSSSVQTSLSTTLDPWLSTLFDHTLAGHTTGIAFVGGAEEENPDPDEETCPLCYKPVGDSTDQHLLRCSYAHEEMERMEWLVKRGREWRGRRGSWGVGDDEE